MNPCWLLYLRLRSAPVAMFLTCAALLHLQQHYQHLGDAASPKCYITNSINGTTAGLTGKQLWMLRPQFVCYYKAVRGFKDQG